MKLKRVLAILLASALSAVAVTASAAPKPPLPPLPPPFLLPPLPDIRFLIPVPRTEVYVVPDAPAGVVFYDGFWWSKRRGVWYRSRDYRREFAPVPPGFVPPPLVRLPPDYRKHYEHGERVPYGEWREKHWRSEWDRDRPNEWERGHGDRGDHGDRGKHKGWERDKDRGRGEGHGHGGDGRGPGRD